jgi:hypothetical protein
MSDFLNLLMQTLPACEDDMLSTVGKKSGFSLHAGVAARAYECDKVERLCRYVSRRLSIRTASLETLREFAGVLTGRCWPTTAVPALALAVSRRSAYWIIKNLSRFRPEVALGFPVA